MLYTGFITLSDNSRHTTNTGNSAFSCILGPLDTLNVSCIIYDATTIAGDKTFFQQQILGPGDLTLILRDWTYSGGYPLDSTTFVDGTWGWLYYDPSYISYSIWYMDYDTSQYSLIGYRYRDPVSQKVGNFYAPMVVPKVPGHYQIRWLYTKGINSYGKEIAQAFTAVSRGIDSMKDYPYAAGKFFYLYEPISSSWPYNKTTIITIPVNVCKNIGDNVVFSLQTHGPVPAPLTYQWRMNFINISDGPRSSGAIISGSNTDTLTIYNVTKTEAAIIDCIVSYSVVSTSAYLIIDPP